MGSSSGRTRREIIVNGVSVALVAIAVLLVVGAILGTVTEGRLGGRDRVGFVQITGVIKDSGPIERQIRYLTETAKVPVILVRLDSPGGAVGASQEIYRELQIARQKGVKIVASMGSLAASGAYYISLAADTIMANPGTLTGSIGVIAEFAQVDTLLSKIGVSFNIIKSGRFKDTGSPFRPMRRDEVLQLQSVINDAYDQFVGAVSSARGIPLDSLKTLAQGQVFTGREAKKLHLIDALGNEDDALAIARKMGGLGPDAELLRAPTRETGLLQRLMGAVTEIRESPSLTFSYRMP